MDDSELFDVFNEYNNPEPLQKTTAGTKDVERKKSKKDKKKDNSKDTQNGTHQRKRSLDETSEKMDVDGETGEIDAAEVSGITKKVRKNTQQPIVVDSFETESDQVVPAIAGLQGIAPTNDNIVIKKRYRHAAVFPTADWKYTPLESHQFTDPPARTYPFELDPFQKMSIAAIERNESVLVSAHTSAGKTVVAEYAIAQALKEKQRVIYTSPIKALSNQKYRELAAEFKDVGLMTGDVTINPTASCIVMTTEILRSMLYRGSEMMREVAWVIFDEIHYMRDKERGVVWEETIILLPDKVHYVFLSATIPNALQFAQWIVKIHSQPCHVVYTDFRPTPLQHYLFPAGGNGIFLVVDDSGKFREENFQKAMAVVEDKKGDNPNAVFGKGKKGKTWKGGANGGDDPSTDIYKIIKMIMLKNYNPVIVFSFSKRECEHYALRMSKLDFNDKEEKELVQSIYTNALNSLSESDRNLPQVQEILPLLQRGIGIHHAGLLNILKEVIEILFGEGLVKVLFATETFAMGLNMPAKTVVFTNHMKFDGKEMRPITSGEYIQMSGRAGRRGLDDRGVVMLMINGKMEPDVAKNMLMGEADRLNSAFHLSYNMVLNLMRLEGIPPEFMLERCFYQFQNNAEIPEMEKELAELEKQRDEIEVEQETVIAEYYDLKEKIAIYEQDMKDVINHPNYCLPFIQPGRLVKIKYDKRFFDWGVVVNYNKRLKPINQEIEFTPQEGYILDVAMWLDASAAAFKNNPKLKLGDLSGIQPGPPGISEKTGRMEVVPVVMSTVDSISSIRIPLPKDLKSMDHRLDVRKTIEEVKRRFPDGIPHLDPIKNMGIKDESFKSLVKKIEVMESRLTANPLFTSPDLERIYNQYQAKVDLNAKIKAQKKKIQAANSVMQLDELKNRKRVLRRLGFTSSNDVIEMKGRVACEISSADELLLTEMIFQGAFNDLTPEQSAALLSCFVLQEKVEMRQPLKDEALTNPLKLMNSIARRIAKVSQESKMPVIEEEYIASFRPELMDVVYSWAKGATFQEICKKTDIYEGSLIRAFRLLAEVLRQMVQAAKAIGNTELENKFAAAITAIKRDIIFAPSLYL